VCGKSSRTLLHEGLRDRIFFCAPGEWRLYRCTSCGSGYLDPRPTAETIGMAYSRYFTHRHEARAMSAFRRLRLALANGYCNARFGIKRRPYIRGGAWLAHLFPRRRASIDAYARNLDRAQPGEVLLDVGCGDGLFLAFAAEMGWKVEGVEPDPQAAEAARKQGLTIHQGSIECLRDRGEVFDVITLSHVIEHVHDPHDLMAACFRLLKPGGRIWLETPNLEAAGHLRYGRDWRGLEPPRHLVLFTWASLHSLLSKAGFLAATPLPAHPMASFTFPASDAIRRDKDPNALASIPVRVRWQAWRADLRPALTKREFITIVARKPSASAGDAISRGLLRAAPTTQAVRAASP